MSTEHFAGSRTKLRRAVKFIDELDSEFETYNKTALSAARIDVTVDPPVLHIEWTGLRLDAAAILGDAIHNLRASLDLMASELARINKESDKGVYFPFAESVDALDGQIKDKKFLRAGTDAVTLLKKFAPYKDGNVRLRAIHDLDVADKHRAILETEKQMNVRISASLDLEDPKNHSASVEESTIQHFFTPDSALAKLPIIQTLKELVGLVEGIINEFQDLVAKRV
ncbi:hypothetical protein M0765_026385 [Variovorax sp. S2]|uniref:hypothetical protein n=1 Tax=Variovorax sp. S12S4 TaxID=3029170 RepID=UPI00215C7214|nr:hypothetical protein [Variovorax sp. S12S4]MCR8961127.1 hypothetical protein [Variovorax sp. S12S4]